MEKPPFEFAEEDYDLAPLTLYRVGGPARVALFPRSVQEARDACEWMGTQPGPRLVLGGGSNVLVSDKGFPGVVMVTTGLDGIEPLEGDRCRVLGGTELDRVVREVMLEHNYAGVGALAGIPGSVGGAIYMNAGTANGSTCEVLESVDLVGLEGPSTVEIDPSLFGYREQHFCPPETLILSAVFRFEVADEDQRAIYDRYIERRREKQPSGNCCGSVFKNPEGEHAGRLIELSGLKGMSKGGAVVSPVHANFIMNEGDASFDDILWLIRLCQRRVLDRFGIELQEEVRIVE